jgi:hypothetical protein
VSGQVVTNNIREAEIQLLKIPPSVENLLEFSLLGPIKRANAQLQGRPRPSLNIGPPPIWIPA